MSNETFKKSVYIIIAILILVFFTKDIPLFGDDLYKDINIIDNPHDILVLVNKENKLSSSFIPNDLEFIDIKYSNEDKLLVKNAKEQFESLSRDASVLGYKIIAVSAYRDYEYQRRLYEQYVIDKGKWYADNCSARPGHSEHQTGLAIDVMGSNNDYDEFENSYEFEWMKNNAYKYGFILRYPKDKEEITGFKYEPWHYRYVGKDVAKIMYNNDLTLEEYYKNYKK